jgi:hypothetical protein
MMSPPSAVRLQKKDAALSQSVQGAVAARPGLQGYPAPEIEAGRDKFVSPGEACCTALTPVHVPVTTAALS